MSEVITCTFNDSHITSQIFEIRTKVFVIEQKVSREEEFDEFEASSVHYLGKAGDVPAATARWRITNTGIKLERFAVLSEFRNSGLGTKVLNKVLVDVIPLNIPIYLNAQVKAIRFYEKAGFRKIGKMFIEADIEHFKMTFVV